MSEFHFHGTVGNNGVRIFLPELTVADVYIVRIKFAVDNAEPFVVVTYGHSHVTIKMQGSKKIF